MQQPIYHQGGFMNKTNEKDLVLVSNIQRYEELCEAGSAQGNEAKGLLHAIKGALEYRGREYNTLTLAKLGSKRSLAYIKRGLVDGYAVSDTGELIKV
jgi:hypothetical protein